MALGLNSYGVHTDRTSGSYLHRSAPAFQRFRVVINCEIAESPAWFALLTATAVAN